MVSLIFVWVDGMRGKAVVRRALEDVDFSEIIKRGETKKVCFPDGKVLEKVFKFEQAS